jgi:RNA polymerase subunit RPABC4/transcription elongation factor Spt4
MLDCKPIDTSMDPNVKLMPKRGTFNHTQVDTENWLNYLIVIRPNISLL